MKKFSSTLLTLLFFALVFVGTSNAQNNPPDSTKEQKVENQEKDQPLQIKRKPQVKIGRCRQRSGFARLRVTFDKSGEITNAAVIISSHCDSFNENAIDAARKIEFEPAIKNGEPVTVTKLVEYRFRKF